MAKTASPRERKLRYEGRVTLLCQEGGAADYGIGLDEIPGTPRDMTHKVLAMLSGPPGASLADELKRFAAAEPDRYGDIPLGRLRITVERLPPSPGEQSP